MSESESLRLRCDFYLCEHTRTNCSYIHVRTVFLPVHGGYFSHGTLASLEGRAGLYKRGVCLKSYMYDTNVTSTAQSYHHTGKKSEMHCGISIVGAATRSGVMVGLLCSISCCSLTNRCGVL